MSPDQMRQWIKDTSEYAGWGVGWASVATTILAMLITFLLGGFAMSPSPDSGFWVPVILGTIVAAVASGIGLGNLTTAVVRVALAMVFHNDLRDPQSFEPQLKQKGAA